MIIKIVSILSLLFFVSCAHSPSDSFKKVQPGDDKQAVLEKVGSPVRSRHKNGQDIWTYRLYKEGNYDNQDVVFQNQKVKEIRPATEVKDIEIKDKEEFIEKQLKENKKQPRVLEKAKLPVMEEESSTKKKSDFVPVE